MKTSLQQENLYTVNRIFRIKQNGKYKTKLVIKEYEQKKENYRETSNDWT